MKLSGVLKRRINKFSDPSMNEHCTQFEVNKWIISEFAIEKIVPIVGCRPYPLDELILMIGAVCRFKPTHIFEWGTHIGKSARIFYETAKAFEIRAEIHSFDLPDDQEHIEHPHETRGLLLKGLDDIKLYQEDGLISSFKIFRESTHLKKRALFYVDGDHSYESVYRELTAILENVPDAVILLHDTFYQSEGSQYNIGPFQAIQDIIVKTNYKDKRIETAGMGLPGMSLVFSSNC